MQLWMHTQDRDAYSQQRSPTQELSPAWTDTHLPSPGQLRQQSLLSWMWLSLHWAAGMSPLSRWSAIELDLLSKYTQAANPAQGEIRFSRLMCTGNFYSATPLISKWLQDSPISGLLSCSLLSTGTGRDPRAGWSPGEECGELWCLVHLPFYLGFYGNDPVLCDKRLWATMKRVKENWLQTGQNRGCAPGTEWILQA